MSDTFYASLFIFLGLIVNAYVQLKTKLAVENSAEKVSNAITVTSSIADKKLTDIHTLVNSNMGAQLKIGAIALRRIAIITKDAADIEAAKVAEDLLAEHVRKQAIVDSGGKS